MIPQLELFPLANGSMPRVCGCGCLATHLVVASRPGQRFDRAMPVCGRDAVMIRRGSPRLRVA